MKYIAAILFLFAAAFLLPVWAYGAGWGYLFSGVAAVLVVMLLVAPLFASKKEAKLAQRTKAYPEFMDDQSIPSHSSKGA